MFYLFVLGCALIVAVVVTLVRGDVPAARRWTLLLVASVVMGPAATLFSGAFGLPEGLDALIAVVVTPVGFTAGALGAGLVMVRSGDHRDLGVALLISGGSVGLLAMYAAFAVLVTSMVGGDSPLQAVVELIVELGVATGVALGAAGAILAFLQRGRRYAGSLQRLP